MLAKNLLNKLFFQELYGSIIKTILDIAELKMKILFKEMLSFKLMVSEIMELIQPNLPEIILTDKISLVNLSEFLREISNNELDQKSFIGIVEKFRVLLNKKSLLDIVKSTIPLKEDNEYKSTDTIPDSKSGIKLYLLPKLPTKEELKFINLPAVIYDTNQNISHLIVKPNDITVIYDLEKLRKTKNFNSIESELTKLINKHYKVGFVFLAWKNTIIDWITSKDYHSLTTEQELNHLIWEINNAKKNAEKIQKKDLVFFIGNTGSGKSTLINYLHGCKFISRKEKQGKKTKYIVMVDPGSSIKEITTIGHSEESQTLSPQILDGSLKQQLVYCDCPGFADNRGSKINIINAFNIKYFVTYAKTVKLLIVVDYKMMDTNRGQLFNELKDIILKFFGNKEEIISQNNLAILVVVSKMPSGDQVLNITEIRENLCDDDSVIPWTKENIFVYDPLNNQECIANGASNRDKLISKIISMHSIKDHKTIFEVALNTQDIEYLITISLTLETKILDFLSQNIIEQISEYLYLLNDLKKFNNDKVFMAFNRSVQNIKNHVNILIQEIKDLCKANKFENAENKLFLLQKMKETLDRELCDLEGEYIAAKEYLKIEIINNIKHKLAISVQTLFNSFHEDKQLQERICADIFLLFLEIIPQNPSYIDLCMYLSKLVQLTKANIIVANTLALYKNLVEMFCIATKYEIEVKDYSEELIEILKIIKLIIATCKALIIEQKKVRLTDISIHLSKNILEITEANAKTSDKEELLNYIITWKPDLENNLLNLSILLKNLSSIDVINARISNIIPIFLEAAEIAEFLADNVICDANINRIFIDLKDRVVKIIETHRLLSLIKEGIKKYNFSEIKNYIIALEQLNSSMLAYAGIEECIQFLCKSFYDGFKWSNFEAASNAFRDLLYLDSNLGEILNRLQCIRVIKCDVQQEIQKINKHIVKELDGLMEEAKKEIIDIFSEKVLQSDKQEGTSIDKLEILFSISKFFNFLDLVVVKVNQLLEICKSNIREAYHKLKVEQNKERSFIKTINFLLWARAIVCITNNIDLKTELDTETITLIKSYEKFISQMGSILIVLAGGVSKINRYAAELIEKYPEFIRFKREHYNKKVSKGITKILEELQIKEASKLKEAYNGYNQTYESLLSKVVSAFQEPNSQEQSKQTCQAILNSAVNQSKQISKDFKEKDFLSKDPEKIGNIIGYIFGVWTCLDAQNGGFGSDTKKLLQPHAAQVVSILLLLGINNNDRINNHLLQIKTGEGKSVTIAITSIILALLGYKVDVACYSVYLAARDQRDFKKLFELFKVTQFISYLNFDSLVEASIQKIGNTRELGKQLLQNAIEGGTVYYSENYSKIDKILFIDEVDVFFSENFLGKELNTIIIINDESFKNLLNYIWKNRKTLLSNKEKAKVDLTNHAFMREFLSKYPNAIILIDLTLDKIFQGLKDIDQGNHQYDKDPKRGIGYKDDTLGIVNYHSFRGYCTTFAYIKEQEIGFFSKTCELVNTNVGLNLHTGSLSYMEIPKDYNFIIGVTGTLFSLSDFESKIIEGYGIYRKTAIPSIFARKTLYGETDIKVCDGDIDAEDSQGYFYNIRDEIIKVYKRDRAILVVFENYERLIEFKNFIRSHPYEKLQNINPNIIALEETSSDEDKDSYYLSSLIESAASSNTLTYLTRIYGRGSDFVCRDSKLTNNGGVHVIQTFFSEYESEEIQIKGRTCRQDDPGSYKMILYLKDLKKFGITKFADLDEFKTENQDFAIEWYEFLKKKRTIYLGDKGSKLKTAMKESAEKHQDTVFFINLLESSGPKSSILSRLPLSDNHTEKRKEEAKKLLFKFNS